MGFTAVLVALSYLAASPPLPPTSPYPVAADRCLCCRERRLYLCRACARKNPRSAKKAPKPSPRLPSAPVKVPRSPKTPRQPAFRQRRESCALRLASRRMRHRPACRRSAAAVPPKPQVLTTASVPVADTVGDRHGATAQTPSGPQTRSPSPLASRSLAPVKPHLFQLLLTPQDPGLARFYCCDGTHYRLPGFCL